MFKKISDWAKVAKRKATAKMIEIQADVIVNENRWSSRAGRWFLAGCLAVSGSFAPALATGGGAPAPATGGGTADDIATQIKSGVAKGYGAMKSIGIVVAAVGVALAAFYLFTGGDKGMEKAKKTLLYTVLGCGILFLAVPIVTFIAGLFDSSGNGFDKLPSYTTP